MMERPMVQRLIILVIFFLLTLPACQKNPVASDEEPLEFPGFPETSE